jgi:O-antigen/teichoic acid export membrane protein
VVADPEAGLPSRYAARRLEPPSQAPERLRHRLLRSDTGRAAGLAAALMANNFIQLIFTVVFARLLGTDGYGTLGALLAAFVVLLVPGSALQATVAREVSAAAVEGHENPAKGVWRWLERLLLATVVVTVVSILLRDPIGAAIGVDDAPWAAAAIVPTGMLWLILCVQRGVLQGLGRYRTVGLSIVGDAAGRLIFGVLLYAAGAGVTGAFMGTTLGVIAVSLLLVPPLARSLGGVRGREVPLGLRALLAASWAPVLAFSLIAALQNIDIIYVKHDATTDEASAYVAATVAAKAVIWVAIGLGLYLLPEAVRRTRAGEDARPVLWRTLALIAAIATPMVLVYAVAGQPLLAAVFGSDLDGGADALPLLGLAMSLLACGYLAVQFLLALMKSAFVLLLAVAVAAEVGLLIAFGTGLVDVAWVLVAVQAVLTPTLLGLALHAAHRHSRSRALA